MEYLDEAHLGFHRIDALIERDQVAHQLFCRSCDPDRQTEAYLAFLGWTGRSFLHEAFPEFYGSLDA